MAQAKKPAARPARKKAAPAKAAPAKAAAAAPPAKAAPPISDVLMGYVNKLPFPLPAIAAGAILLTVLTLVIVLIQQ